MPDVKGAAGVVAVRAPAALLPRSSVLKAVLLGYVVFAVTYVPINHWTVGREAATLYLPGEERIPFIPAFEWLYVLTYGLPLLLVVHPPDRQGLRRAVRAFGLTLTVAYATYLVFPVYLERPRFEVDSVATFLLALEYLDPSYNHFPSLHVAISWLVYLACRGRVPRPNLLLLTVIGVSSSTLFVKQHYFVDVAYGFLLTVAAWGLAGRFDREGQGP